MRWLGCLAFGGAIALGGCFDVEEKIVLDKDLSGTASVQVTVDFEPVAYFWAVMGKQLREEPGGPSVAELERAKWLMLHDLGEDGGFFTEGFANAMNGPLPEGVWRLEADSSREELKEHFKVRFGFDHVAKLAEVVLALGENGELDRDNPVERPLGGLRIVDEGETLLITHEPFDLDTAEQWPQSDESSSEQGEFSEYFAAAASEAMLGVRMKARYVFTIEAPFEIVEHNATRVEGDVLIWEYDSEQSPPDSGEAFETMRVCFSTTEDESWSLF